MKPVKSLFLVITIVVYSGCFATLSAQSDEITAQAAVLEALTVSAQRDLDFGNIMTGTTVEVLPNDNNSGYFFLSGQAETEVTVQFTLPTELDRDGGPETLTIEFDNNFGIQSEVDDPDVGAAFDPTSSSTLETSLAGELYIYLGGRVIADASQEPGNYSATITLSVEYTN